jgi:hypothetical protein
MKKSGVLTLGFTALLGLTVALPGGDALAQQKQRVSYKIDAANAKFPQQHVIEIGDVPGHKLRVYELLRVFPNNAPVINGVKLKETWSRGVSDYIEESGPNYGYAVFVLENGDKFFGRFNTLSEHIGPGKLKYSSVTAITGGTGKFSGIHGTVWSSGTTDLNAGINETQSEIEYWIDK